MPRYLVTTRRSERDSAITAADAVKNEPGITPVQTNDPQMVTIEASEQAADRLRQKLSATHYVEPEIHRSLQ
jgi:hypothetical protein